MNARSPEEVALGDGGTRMAVSLLHASLPTRPREGRALVVPPDEQLRIVLADAKSAGKLKDLRQVVAAWEAVAEKCVVARHEMVRLGAFRLEVERDLGSQLAQTVRHGGDRSRSPKGILPSRQGLPDGISPNQSSLYQRLAAIPADVFQAYIEEARTKTRVPSSSGALRFAAPPRPAHYRKRSRASASRSVDELPSRVIDAVSRVITPDVCVGDANISAKRRLAARSKNVFEQLAGDVFVADCPEPALWPRTLQRLRKKAQVRDVIVVLPAAVWEDWFRALRTDEWTLCFLEGVRSTAGVGVAVAHAGTRQRAFRLVFEPLGAIVPS